MQTRCRKISQKILELTKCPSGLICLSWILALIVRRRFLDEIITTPMVAFGIYVPIATALIRNKCERSTIYVIRVPSMQF